MSKKNVNKFIISTLNRVEATEYITFAVLCQLRLELHLPLTEEIIMKYYNASLMGTAYINIEYTRLNKAAIVWAMFSIDGLYDYILTSRVPHYPFEFLEGDLCVILDILCKLPSLSRLRRIIRDCDINTPVIYVRRNRYTFIYKDLNGQKARLIFKSPSAFIEYINNNYNAFKL